MWGFLFEVLLALGLLQLVGNCILMYMYLWDVPFFFHNIFHTKEMKKKSLKASQVSPSLGVRNQIPCQPAEIPAYHTHPSSFRFSVSFIRIQNLPTQH